MEFLKEIDEDDRLTAEIILKDETLSNAEKLDVLRGMLLEERIVHAASKYLNLESGEDSDVEIVDFRDLMDDRKKSLANVLVKQEKWDSLKKIVAGESQEVQAAFETFFANREKQELKKEVVGSSSSDRKAVSLGLTPPAYQKDHSSIATEPRVAQAKQGKSAPLPPTSSKKLTASPAAKPVASLDSDEEDDGRKEKDGLKKAKEQENKQREDEWMSNIDLDMFKHFPECLNILVLGETGVGKSTFINALVNYLRYSNMHQAKANGVEILIKAAFTQMDQDLNMIRVDCIPTIEGPDDDDNEDLNDGTSSTQKPKAYLFNWGPEGNQKSVRIIDTPGIGDVQGLEKDAENFTNILQFIADYKEIHAILILLKPNEARLTVVMRFCINELLAHLHVSAAQNILFCFTNARQTLYAPGETLPSLEAHLNELYEKRGVRIPLKRDTVFCFDNESFRFLCAWRKDIQFEESAIQDFNQSWQTTVAETFRLLKRASTLNAHCTEKTFGVNNIRAIVFSLARPLAEIARNQALNIQLIDDKVKEINTLLGEGKSLKNLNLQTDQVVIEAKEIGHPITVCTAEKCIEMIKFSNNPNASWETYYKQKCHPHCYLTGVQTGIFPNPQIKGCACFNGNIDRCTVCGCDWTTHLHIRYELRKTTKQVTDPSVNESIKRNDDKRTQAEVFLLAEKKRKQELEDESKKIRDYCAVFAQFLTENSLIPYNDVYLEYVDHLIKEENAKVQQGASNAILKQLKQQREMYDQHVSILKHAPRGRGDSRIGQKSAADIMKMLQELQNLPHCGKLLKDVQKLEMLSVRQEQKNNVTKINLRKSWFSRK